MTGRQPPRAEPRGGGQRGAGESAARRGGGRGSPGEPASRAAAGQGTPGEPGAGRAGAGEPPKARRVSRQREAGEATRRETRRRLLAAAKAEFAERGYAAATVIRIAERADMSVQTLYSNWGNKRNLLRAVMESSVTGDEDVPLVARWSSGSCLNRSQDHYSKLLTITLEICNVILEHDPVQARSRR